jgi:hypothetical protein
MDNGKLHVVWNDDDRAPDLYSEIFYKRYDPEPTGIRAELISKPADIGVSAYPNPFNETAVIEYDIAAPSRIQLAVYNLLGQQVAILANGACLPGSYRTFWNAANCPSGIYFARLSANDYSASARMILLK